MFSLFFIGNIPHTGYLTSPLFRGKIDKNGRSGMAMYQDILRRPIGVVKEYTLVHPNSKAIIQTNKKYLIHWLSRGFHVQDITLTLDENRVTH